MLLSLQRVRALGIARVGTEATWPLHILLGWLLAGLANVVLALAEHSASSVRAEWLSHLVDLGRHVGLGFGSAALVWLFRRFLWRMAWLGWLAFAVASIWLGARILPTDLEGLVERSVE